MLPASVSLQLAASFCFPHQHIDSVRLLHYSRCDDPDRSSAESVRRPRCWLSMGLLAREATSNMGRVCAAYLAVFSKRNFLPLAMGVSRGASLAVVERTAPFTDSECGCLGD